MTIPEKITALYFLDYPDADPEDKDYAHTEMRVEVGLSTDNHAHFLYTYSFDVYTVRYAQRNFFDKAIPLVGRSLLIVTRLDGQEIALFLEKHLAELHDWGTKIGL